MTITAISWPPPLISHIFHPGDRTLFLQLGCFGLDITSFCFGSHKASHKLALVLPFNFFLLHCRNCGTKEAIVCIQIKYLYIQH